MSKHYAMLGLNIPYLTLGRLPVRLAVRHRRRLGKKSARSLTASPPRLRPNFGKSQRAAMVRDGGTLAKEYRKEGGRWFRSIWGNIRRTGRPGRRR